MGSLLWAELVQKSPSHPETFSLIGVEQQRGAQTEQPLAAAPDVHPQVVTVGDHA